MSFTIGGWNIGGAVLGASHQTGKRPNLDYYEQLLDSRKAEVICLQEAHSYPDGRRSQVEELAVRLGYGFHVAAPLSPSHIDPEAALSLGIISRHPIRSSSLTMLPNPNLQTRLNTGALWRMHNKGLLTASIAVDGEDLMVTSGHVFPFHRFGASAQSAEFSRVFDDVSSHLMRSMRLGRSVVSIDLNDPNATNLLASSIGRNRFQVAPSDHATTRKGRKQDFLLYSADLRLLDVTILPTESDHAYCEMSVESNSEKTRNP
ncbi:MAG: hypothetical protein C0444_07520 [Microbacterium sp.]|nr:hypothetical protein [Microbacterium sp.]MBA4346124.1 hypothetical protein [Microbacterium sp.]